MADPKEIIRIVSCVSISAILIAAVGLFVPFFWLCTSPVIQHWAGSQRLMAPEYKGGTLTSIDNM
ncbi:MAG: hypothetical protein C7B43_17150 [Sulfobacillus benefaciens]|uniref:Uncharacterized protein n=1 Tax=Sulfobacillus benefaciens TaxID=453960 RepID=A0A2T2WSX0_9FIRM|nr:MAG: hypothetical protein C7B43_17150 [Sulfobacillus benefaciens]